MKFVPALILVSILTAIDQFSKFLVEQNLPFQRSEAFVPFLSFYRTYNEGIAFSSLDFIDNNILAVLITGIILFVLWLWYSQPSDKILTHLGFSFVISGAMGNLIDRILRGHVVDFIQFHTNNWSFAIFNIADSFITIGAVFIIIDELKLMRKSGANS